ncbi:uncharacterized protein LOC123722902 [Papilio machaon]|uniref:uncharacterized protein LOC123722902 n=1 Tax=Papilio machaon TaxID=76193 RepID=UPI001E6658C3|nr:uncharacterized protein LOC123722902 [Papilio machaon]
MRVASQGVDRPSVDPSHPSSPPAGLVLAGPSQAQPSAPAARGLRRMRWTMDANQNALRAYFRAKGGETGGIAYRARMHRFFSELEPSITVTEQNLADRVRYILRSNLFEGAELERLKHEAISASDSPTAARRTVPQTTVQPPAVEPAECLAEVEDDEEEMAAQDIEQMRRILEEAIVETRRMPFENRPRLPRIPLSKRNRNVVRALNPMLNVYLADSRDLYDTDSILFGAAKAVCRYIGVKLQKTGRSTNHRSVVPAWRKRIEDRIAKARALIGRLISFRSGNSRPRIVRSVRMALGGTEVSLSHPDIERKLTERIDDLKQRIAAWGKRIRRCNERTKRFNQNRLFQSDQKRFYKQLEGQESTSGTGAGPDQTATVAFWRNIWSVPVEHSEGSWMQVVEGTCSKITPMDPVAITAADVAHALRRTPNWKSPGLDGLHCYWLKGFVSCHAVLAQQFQEALDSKSLPDLFTMGVTHLVPKDQITADPAKYRPITCLSSVYKTLTSILCAKITRHLNANQVISDAQNGCRGGCRGAKEPLLIDAVIGKLVKRNRRNLDAAWVDYKKAFDSVPHSWLKRVLELYKVDCTVRDFLGHCMGQWSTTLCLLGERMTAAEDRIRYGGVSSRVIA